MTVATAVEDVRPRQRGRPFDEDATVRILAVTFQLLSEVGYGHLSVQVVAQRAGVTRPTIYRRWPTKHDLAIASVAQAQGGVEDVIATGDLERDLVAHLERIQFTMTAVNGMVIVASFLTESATTPDLTDSFNRQVIQPRRAAIGAAFERAHPDWDEIKVTVFSDLVAGAYYAWAIAGGPFPPDWATLVARCILDGAGPVGPIAQVMGPASIQSHPPSPTESANARSGRRHGPGCGGAPRFGSGQAFSWRKVPSARPGARLAPPAARTDPLAARRPRIASWP